MSESKMTTVVLLMLSVVLIILGSICVGSANGLGSDESIKTKKTNIKNSGTGVLVIGIVLLLVGGYKGYEEFVKHKNE